MSPNKQLSSIGGVIKFYRTNDTKSEIIGADLTNAKIANYMIANGLPHELEQYGTHYKMPYKLFIQMVQSMMSDFDTPTYMQIFDGTKYRVNISLPINGMNTLLSPLKMIPLAPDHLKIPNECDIRIDFVYKCKEFFSVIDRNGKERSIFTNLIVIMLVLILLYILYQNYL